jgi:hypothetical protein
LPEQFGHKNQTLCNHFDEAGKMRLIAANCSQIGKMLMSDQQFAVFVTSLVSTRLSLFNQIHQRSRVATELPFVDA